MLHQSQPRNILALFPSHAHIGSYYSRFVPTELVECPCGEARQTRKHILLECKRYERFRRILGQHNEDRALDTLLGTEKGIARLAEFIEVCICKGNCRVIRIRMVTL